MLQLAFITLLWLVGGYAGLHLFAAGRRSEGFLWLGSGGVFGLGVFADVSRLHILAREMGGDMTAFVRTPFPKKDDDAPLQGEEEPSLSVGLAVFQFILANWYWFMSTLALRIGLYATNMHSLSETALHMAFTLVGSAVAATVIVLLQYTDMRACNVRGVFGACCGLATTLLAMKTNGVTNEASTQGPIIAGIIVSRMSSRWSTRKNAHRDVVTPTLALLAVGLVVLGTGVVLYSAYNAALNYPISMPTADGGGQTMTIREMMRETKSSNIFQLYNMVMEDPSILNDLLNSMTGDMSVSQAMKLLGIPKNENVSLTKQVVNKAFRRQSLRVHPDKYRGPKEEAVLLQTELGKARDKLMTVATDSTETYDMSSEEMR